ncbi:MAG: class I SAM-dependent methyltransferase [Phormidesmis sp.]
MGFQLSELSLIGAPRHRQMLFSRIKMKALLSLPKQLKQVFFQGEQCYCPICESHLRGYERFGHIANEWCPICTAMRRQRLMWLFLARDTNLLDGTLKRLLHIAPGVALEPRLKQVDNLDYTTGDLFNPDVMVTMDVTDIPFPNGSFDAAICSHVLEHVPDDRKAMREFFRVLLPGGWAVFMVPIRMDQLTDEDLSVSDPKEREKRFGQIDHVRLYGQDFEDRLIEAGFEVSVVHADDVVERSQFKRIGIKANEVLFYCKKKKEKRIHRDGKLTWAGK